MKNRYLILVSLLVLVFSLLSCEKKTSSVGTTANQVTASVGNPNAVVAQIGDLKIIDSEITKGFESDIYEAELKVYEIKFNRLKTLIIEKLMEMDPNKVGLSNDQYLEKYIVQAGAPISEAEIQKFIEERKIPKESLTPELKDRVKNFLSMENKRKSIDVWYENKVKEKNIQIMLSAPARPTFNISAGDAPFFGNKDAKVTLVEFSDFQCPFCAKGSEIIHELKNRYKDQLKVVFKQFPLPFHTQAKGAAEAALCAQSIGGNEKFWAIHDILFQNQNSLDVNSLKGFAKKLGLDSKAFDECLDKHQMVAKIDASIKEASDVGVKSTPTFYINGKIVNGAQPLEVFVDLINQELK